MAVENMGGRSFFVLPLLGALLLAVVAGVCVGSAQAEEERFEPAARGGREAVEELAYRYFPAWRVPWVMSTAACETGGTFDLYAENPPGYVGFDRRLGVSYHFRGPLQVDEVTWSAEAWERFGGPLSDPHVSMQMAAWIVEQYGPGHWPICGQRGGW